MAYGSHGGGRDVSYQLNRLTDILEDINRKLNHALRDLERINHRLDRLQGRDTEAAREESKPQDEGRSESEVRAISA